MENYPTMEKNYGSFPENLWDQIYEGKNIVDYQKL